MKKILIIGIAAVCLSLTSASAQNNAPKKGGGKVCNSLTTYFPQPDYPRAGVKGAVNVFVKIDEEGNVESATAISGHPLARLNAEKAAQKAKFRVTTLSGKPVKISCVLVYQFDAPELIIQKRDAAQLQEKEVTKENLLKAAAPTVIIGKAIKLPKPYVPTGFGGRLKKVEKVLVEAVIDEDGNIISAKATSGHVVLRQISEAAARASKFSQTKILSKNVKAKTLLTYIFTILKSRRAEVLVNYVKAEK